jgi:Rod binding domain-containing protein
MLYVNPIETGSQVRNPLETKNEAKQREAVGEMERFFAYMLLKEMRKSVQTDSLFGGGQQRKLFEEMLDDVLAGEVAESGQWGVGAQISEELRVASMQDELRANMQQQMLNVMSDDSSVGAFPLDTTQPLPLTKTTPRNRIPSLYRQSFALPARQTDGFSLRSSIDRSMPIK